MKPLGLTKKSPIISHSLGSCVIKLGLAKLLIRDTVVSTVCVSVLILPSASDNRACNVLDNCVKLLTLPCTSDTVVCKPSTVAVNVVRLPSLSDILPASDSAVASNSDTKCWTSLTNSPVSSKLGVHPLRSVPSASL